MAVTRRWVRIPHDVLRALMAVGMTHWTTDNPASKAQAWIEVSYLLETSTLEDYSLATLQARWGWSSRSRVFRLIAEVRGFFAEAETAKQFRNSADHSGNNLDHSGNNLDHSTVVDHVLTAENGSLAKQRGSDAKQSGSKVKPSRARVLDLRLKTIDDKTTEGDSEEKDLKEEEIQEGLFAPATVTDPWEKLSKDLKPVERSHLPAIQQFHGELVKKGMRAKALDLKQCRAVIAALAMYPIEDLLLAVQGIQWDDYSKSKRRCLEVGWILNPERIAGWIELGVEGPPPGHPMSRKNLNGAKQDGIDTYRAIMFDLPAGAEHLASAATTMGTEGGAALGNRPVRDMRGIPPIRKL